MKSSLIKPIQRWPVRLGNALAPALAGAHLLPQVGSKDEMMTAAVRSTGLDDFGATFFEEPLSLLLEGIRRDQDLHKMGLFFHRTFLLRFLKTRLKLQDAFKHETRIGAQEIRKPIVILGLPRTGTTRLFNILAEDPAHRTLTLWESYRPTPPPREEKQFTDFRRRLAQFDRSAAYYLGPDFPAIHELRLDGPEECIHLLATSFISWLFALEYNAPEYHEYYMSCDHTPAYEEYLNILKYLQIDLKRERWLLKSPTHIFGIESLLKVFPDACIIQTHRDPTKVISSSASMGMAARGMGSSVLDPHLVGAQVFEQLSQGLQRTIDIRSSIPPRQIIDVQYSDIVRDPLNVVKEIYQHFNVDLGTDALNAMGAEIAHSPQHKKGKHTYSPEDFGFSAEMIELAFSDYREAFSVPREAT
jgi:hypothetical protein